MRCQKEQLVYEEIHNQVKSLRMALEDYTGSNKFHDGAPTGVWPEGLTKANRELGEIRQQLQNALEKMNAARGALNRCLKREGELEEENFPTVNIGVLLEDGKDRQWFRTVLSHDPSLDYIIEPDSVEKLFEFIIHVGKQNKRIKWLVLMGHGSKTHARIGRLNPSDIDINAITKQVSTVQENYRIAQSEVAMLQEQLQQITDQKEKQALVEQLESLQVDLERWKDNLEDVTRQLEMLEGLTNSMAPDALVGLLNCYPAGSPDGRQMMRNLGKIFLEKNGGRVVGCDGLIFIIKSTPLIAWIAGSEDIGLLPWGTMRELVVRPNRCGVPCLHFERYGYCDNKKSKDGSPCWRHR